MIKLNFEQKQKILLMLLQRVSDEAIYREIKNLISNASNIEVLDYLRKIIVTQIALESGEVIKECEIRRVVLLSNQKTNFIDSLLETLILFQMLDTLRDKKTASNSKINLFSLRR